MLYVTSSHVQCLHLLIPLPPILGQSRYSLNISQMNENWTWAGSRALSSESAAMSQPWRCMQLMTPERKDTTGLQFPPVWLKGYHGIPKHNGKLMEKGECHFWTALFPFPPSHYSPLPNSCWPVQSRRGTELILSHSMVVLRTLHFNYIPWNIRTLQIYLPSKKKKEKCKPKHCTC